MPRTTTTETLGEVGLTDIAQIRVLLSHYGDSRNDELPKEANVILARVTVTATQARTCLQSQTL